MTSAAAEQLEASRERLYHHVEVKVWPQLDGTFAVIVYGDGADALHAFGAPNEAAAKQLFDEVLRRLRALGGVVES
jgi:hypothetical protein